MKNISVPTTCCSSLPDSSSAFWSIEYPSGTVAFLRPNETTFDTFCKNSFKHLLQFPKVSFQVQFRDVASAMPSEILELLHNSDPRCLLKWLHVPLVSFTDLGKWSYCTCMMNFMITWWVNLYFFIFFDDEWILPLGWFICHWVSLFASLLSVTFSSKIQSKIILLLQRRLRQLQIHRRDNICLVPRDGCHRVITLIF